MLINTPHRNGLSYPLQLRNVDIDPAYRKKWNIHETDFVQIYKDGKVLRDTLYRRGNPGPNMDKPYFQLIKHIEEFYSDDITEDKARKPHLAGHWCIIDEYGEEKFVADCFEYIYIWGCLYSIKQNFYYTETNKFICNSSKTITTENYIFIHDAYNKDKNLRGVYKIDKNGETEFIR